MKADDENLSHLQHIMQVYEECSGQVINKEKSKVMFSRNTGDEARQIFLQDMNLSHEARSDRYLGLPVYMV